MRVLRLRVHARLILTRTEVDEQRKQPYQWSRNRKLISIQEGTSWSATPLKRNSWDAMIRRLAQIGADRSGVHANKETTRPLFLNWWIVYCNGVSSIGNRGPSTINPNIIKAGVNLAWFTDELTAIVIANSDQLAMLLLPFRDWQSSASHFCTLLVSTKQWLNTVTLCSVWALTKKFTQQKKELTK